MKLHEAIAVTYAAMGQEVSDAALKIMTADLSAYPLDGVLHALSRCRKELRKVTLSDVIDRVPGGHLGVEEAWALVSKALNDEGATVVWTDQIKDAFFIALELADEPIAARMAFKETYIKAVAIAREAGRPIVWTPSLGTNAGGREPVLLEAVQKGRLAAVHAKRLLPNLEIPALPAGLEVKRIPETV